MPPGDIVISDVRYPNEAHWVWSLGGHLLRIVRPGVEATNEEERASLAEVDAISTRRTFFVDNHGTIDDLHRKVDAIWRNL